MRNQDPRRWLILAVLGLATAGLAIAKAVASYAPSARLRPAAGEVEATDEAVEAALGRLEANARAERAKWKMKGFDEFEKSVYREPFEGGKYVVSGDVALASRDELRDFFEAFIQHDPPKGLIVHQVDGKDAVWSAGEKRKLTYCVSTGFGNRHAAVVRDMQAAAGAWEAAAQVDFVHRDAEDRRCNASNPNVVFDVRPVDVGGQYLARAFFPNEPRAARNVLIDASSFALPPGEPLQLVGILRHELGHTIGLRHEHTRPEAGVCFEDADWRPITDYDAFSVMHYPQCNGGGDWALQLTANDQRGVACLYGPAPGFALDPSSCPAPVPADASGAPPGQEP